MRASTNEKVVVALISIWALALVVGSFTHESSKRAEIQNEMWIRPLEGK